MSKYRILLVGETNLTRSIMAEAILKKVLQEHGVEDTEVVSRGLVVLFSEPISPRAAAVLYEHSCDSASNKRSTELTQEDIDTADIILTIGKDDAEHIREHFTVNTTCMYLGTFIDMEEELPKIDEDTKEAYEALYQVTRQAMEAAADRLNLELLIP